MKLSLLVAVAENGVIGRDGKLPWHLAADLRRFKRLTMGHAILMGRKTWESIGRPLPGRTSIVITRQEGYRPASDQVLVADSIDQALAIACQANCEQDQLFIIGGSAIYESTLSRASRLYLTRVHAKVDGDVVLPPIDWNQWNLQEQSHHEADEQNDHPFSFERYERADSKGEGGGRKGED